MKNTISQKDIKKGQLMYIFEAALEYFISIMVAGSFLATLTKELGFSDSLTGILSSVISLGCLFQLLSLFFRRKRVKKFVILMSVINQLLFAFLYVIPFFQIASAYKIALFIIVIISAYIIYNFAHPKKINWFMSLVEDSKRGSFTANKEIVSLITGIFFHFGMGALIDFFIAKNQTKTAFLIAMAVILVCLIFHTITEILTVETETELGAKTNFFSTLKSLLKNKNLLNVIVIFILYNISLGLTTPFYGTYLISELDFSLTFVSVLTIGSSVVRILFSRLFGRFADKTSFARMLEICFIVLLGALISVTLANPATGKFMFTAYYILHGIAMAGISSSLINLVFDTASKETRSDALAITQAVSGLTAFLVTLAVSPFVTLIQQNNNRILGITVYAQQLFSFIGIIAIVVGIIFMRLKVIKKKS